MSFLPQPDWSELVADSTLAESPEALARKYGPLVFKAAYRVLGDAALAEDVQQDVFLGLIESRPRGVDSWPAYLSASAARAAIDVLRRQRRWWRLLPLLWSSSASTTTESPELIGMEHEQAKQLRNALAQLPRREAQCFSLRYLQGMEIGEIAGALGLSENNTNVTLHRARRRLEARLADAIVESKP
jgi:RNA polymerase sigma-70 factor (ECF subfamily)